MISRRRRRRNAKLRRRFKQIGRHSVGPLAWRRTLSSQAAPNASELDYTFRASRRRFMRYRNGLIYSVLFLCCIVASGKDGKKPFYPMRS